MRSLLLSVLLLLPTALAGGVAPRSGPLAAGQVWELTATRKDGLSVRLQMRLGRQISNDASGQTYAAEGLMGGGHISSSPKERGIDATVRELNSLQCFAQFTPGSNVAQGSLLYGSGEWNNERLGKAQRGTDFSRASLLRGLKPLSDGTCTLKRLR
ncbi:hypothetical protein L1280_001903 [Deinococcus sp. HSC-46F16]|uniref:hypothetical protein n=1 Tax=Deinococcus sp. HSC-46F16 TaxID=2910968 RepID=UPI00209EA30F|nr:hypothetical protein [Deinococcus sp. HSC-46F16]MCP2014751.1 hypothetical protein [Deinococcus sp. HSC-46F16]